MTQAPPQQKDERLPENGRSVDKDARPKGKLHRHKRVKRKCRRYSVLLSYDGSRFAGLQRQPGRRTVEGTLLEALAALDLPTSLSYSGRTDAGVHALGQVAVIRLPLERAADEALASLARQLPPDIRIRAHAPAPQSFHPRWSAEEKRYVYWLRLPDAPPCPSVANNRPREAKVPDAEGGARVWDAAKGDPTDLSQSLRALVDQGISGITPWELDEPFDLSRFHHALDDLRHAPDLRGFTAHDAPFRKRPPLRRLACQIDGALVRLSFQGPGFGRYAIRHMVGCAVSVARGELPMDACAVTALAEVPYRGTRAPASALLLDSVRYPPSLDPFRAQ